MKVRSAVLREMGAARPYADSRPLEIAEGKLIPTLMKKNLSPRELVSELFLRCFGRTPSEQELVKLETHMGVAEEQPKVYTDIFWALLNAKEFMFNH